MDPKVCSKLLTTHWRGYGVDVEALHGRFPLRRSTGEGSKMGSRGYRRLRWWKLCFVVLLYVFGYVGIYIGGRSTSVAARGAHERGGVPCRGGRAPNPRGCLGCFLTCTLSPLDHVRSKNHASKGFIPFGLRLIFLFFEILK